MTRKSEKGLQEDVAFEVAVGKLEEIVRNMEKGELTLEQSLDCFEEGIRWAKVCEKKLNEAKGRIEMLVKKDGGELKTVKFDVKEV